MSDIQQVIRRAYEENAGIEQVTRTQCSCLPGSERAEDGQNNLGGCGGCGYPHQQEMHVCGFGVHHGVLAAVYVPLNGFDGVYDPDTAYRRGTMFEGLDKPFYGDGTGGGCRGNEK